MPLTFQKSQGRKRKSVSYIHIKDFIYCAKRINSSQQGDLGLIMRGLHNATSRSHTPQELQDPRIQAPHLCTLQLQLRLWCLNCMGAVEGCFLVMVQVLLQSQEQLVQESKVAISVRQRQGREAIPFIFYHCHLGPILFLSIRDPQHSCVVAILTLEPRRQHFKQLWDQVLLSEPEVSHTHGSFVGVSQLSIIDEL